MPSLLDYLARTGQQSFEALPLTELDIVCLNELGYLPFGEYLSGVNCVTEEALADLVAHLSEPHLPQLDFLVTPNRLALARAVLEAPRFAGLSLSHYVNDVSREHGRQFAAMVMSLPSIGHRQVVFRGTDDSLVGWKEDFALAYRTTVPAQLAAKAYLEDVLATLPGPILVSGHSKGGNLALYASSQLTADEQSRLTAVYVLDAPGLHQSLLTSHGYQSIKERLIGLRPSGAVVGVLLGADFAYETVSSQAKGILQHDVFSWQVLEKQFQREAGLSEDSLILEKTVADWLATYPSEEFRVLCDCFFDLFFDLGIASLNDLSGQGWERRLQAIFQAFAQLDKAEKDRFSSSLGQLISLYQKHRHQARQAARQDQWQAFVQQLAGLGKDKKD